MLTAAFSPWYIITAACHRCHLGLMSLASLTLLSQCALCMFDCVCLDFKYARVCVCMCVRICVLKRHNVKQRAVHYDTAWLYGFTYLAEEHWALIDGVQTGKYKYTLTHAQTGSPLACILLAHELLILLISSLAFVLPLPCPMNKQI